MTNIVHFIDSLKKAWVKRFLNVENQGKWKILFKNELVKVGGDWIWSCKPAIYVDFNYDRICITFLRDVLKSWFKM